MTISTVSTYGLPVNNVFQNTLLRNAKALAPYFVGAMPGTLALHEGTATVKWRRYENLAPSTSALSALTGAESYPFRSGTTVSITDPTASVQKYGQVFMLNEEVDLQNFDNQTDKLIEVLAIAAGRSLNQLQRNELEDNSTFIYAGNVAADGDVANVISLTEIRNAVNVLQRNSALKFRPAGLGDVRIGTTPVRPGYVMLSHVDVEEDVRDIPSFKPVETYAGHTETYLGEYGAVHGVRCISSEDASQDADLGDAPGGSLRSTTGASADLYTSVIFGQDAHGAVGFGVEMVKEIYQAGDSLPAIELIAHGRGSAGVMDPLNELKTLAYKAWHAAKILNATWIRAIRSGASKLTV
jgi:N4-gp56 family major capsid protein